MKRYFDIPDAKNTLMVEAKKGSSGALASPERIARHFKINGVFREITQSEYIALTKIYTEGVKAE